MNRTIFLALIFVFSLGVVFAPLQGAYAQDAPVECSEKQRGGLVPCGRSCDDPTTEINEAAECDFCHFFYLLKNIIDWIVFRIAPVLAVLLVVFGGFILATSRGNPGQSQKGKDILIWTFAGLAVIFVSWLVVNSLFAGLGVTEWTGLQEGWWQFSCGLN